MATLSFEETANRFKYQKSRVKPKAVRQSVKFEGCLGPLEENVLITMFFFAEPCSAAEVSKTIEDHLANGERVSIAAIYAVLDRLEDKNLVLASEQESKKKFGDRPRRVYQIKSEGREYITSLNKYHVPLWTMPVNHRS